MRCVASLSPPGPPPALPRLAWPAPLCEAAAAPRAPRAPVSGGTPPVPPSSARARRPPLKPAPPGRPRQGVPDGGSSGCEEADTLSLPPRRASAPAPSGPGSGMDVRFYPAAAGDPAGLDFAQCLGYYGYSKVTGPGAAGRGVISPSRARPTLHLTACCTFLSLPLLLYPLLSLCALASVQLSPLLFLPLPAPLFVPRPSLSSALRLSSPTTPRSPWPPRRSEQQQPRDSKGTRVRLFVAVISRHDRSPPLHPHEAGRGAPRRGHDLLIQCLHIPPKSIFSPPPTRELVPGRLREGQEQTFERVLDTRGGGGTRSGGIPAGGFC